MDKFYFALLAVTCLVSLTDWRRGLYLAFLLDALRDPVRKLAPGQSVLITLSVTVVWLPIVLGAVQGVRLSQVFQRLPVLRQVLQWVVLALVPGAMLSCFLYAGGYKLAVLGAASYLAPFAGILLGFLFATSDRDIYKLLAWYCLINSVMLVGVPLEYLDADVPGLGGIEMEWVRQRQGYVVDLIGGFYRSPDIMGLHAAHVVMFAAMLAARPAGTSKGAWLAVVVWASFCLLLSGRRKMIGIPLVFAVSHLLIGMWRGAAWTSRFSSMAAASALAVLAIAMLFGQSESGRDYSAYATTLFTEGGSRADSVVVGSTTETVRQLGMFGAGLGTGTQGRYYTGVETPRNARGWQEDGVSRLFLELGTPGTALLLVGLATLLKQMIAAVRFLPPQHRLLLLQVGLLSVVIADAASFMISHQQFSGDPTSAILVMLMVGMVFAIPQLYLRESRFRRSGPASEHSSNARAVPAVVRARQSEKARLVSNSATLSEADDDNRSE